MARRAFNWYCFVVCFLCVASVALAADMVQQNSQPDAAFTGNVVLVICLVGGQLLTLLMSALGLWISSKRQPPVAEEMHKTFVPRSEYLECVQRMHERIDKS